MRNKTIILTKINFKIKYHYFLAFIIRKTREVRNLRKVRVNIDDIHSYEYIENIPSSKINGIRNGLSIKPHTWVEIIGNRDGGFRVTETGDEIEKLINKVSEKSTKI